MKPTTLVVCVLFTLFKIGWCGKFYPTYGAAKYYNSYPLALSWHQAYRYCNRLAMYLVDIRTEEENTRIVNYIQTTNEDNKNNLNFKMPTYWTSGTDAGNEGDFFWMTTGETFLYSDWYRTNPDNWLNKTSGETENCVALSADRSYQWNDEGCSQKRHFICRNTFVMPDYKSQRCFG